MVRVPVLYAGGRRFKSDRVNLGSMAKWLRHLTFNQTTLGSNPSAPTMNKRPMGVDPLSNREFVIANPQEYSRRNRLRDWWFYLKNFSFGRGTSVEVDVDDQLMQELQYMGWVRNIKDNEWRMTRKGSRELSEFMKEILNRLDEQRK